MPTTRVGHVYTNTPCAPKLSSPMVVQQPALACAPSRDRITLSASSASEQTVDYISAGGADELVLLKGRQLFPDDIEAKMKILALEGKKAKAIISALEADARAAGIVLSTSKIQSYLMQCRHRDDVLGQNDKIPEIVATKILECASGENPMKAYAIANVINRHPETYGCAIPYSRVDSFLAPKRGDFGMLPRDQPLPQSVQREIIRIFDEENLGVTGITERICNDAAKHGCMVSRERVGSFLLEYRSGSKVLASKEPMPETLRERILQLRQEGQSAYMIETTLIGELATHGVVVPQGRISLVFRKADEADNALARHAALPDDLAEEIDRLHAQGKRRRTIYRIVNAERSPNKPVIPDSRIDARLRAKERAKAKARHDKDDRNGFFQADDTFNFPLHDYGDEHDAFLDNKFDYMGQPVSALDAPTSLAE